MSASHKARVVPDDEEAISTEDPNVKLQELQKTLDEATEITKGNFDKLLWRGEGLDVMLAKSHRGADSARSFRRGAIAVRNQMKKKAMQMKSLVVVGIIILLIVIIVPCVIIRR